jgi:EmrB/QacA subfamily drug resistance transporter
VIIFGEVSSEASARRWIAFGVVCVGVTMTVIDATIVNVALPTIQRNLHFSQAGLAWVIDAYLITYAGFLLLAGRMGDLVGRKKVFLGGVALFTLSSALCGLADSQAMLVAARFAQGTGAAFTASVVLAIVVGEFPDLRERSKALNTYIVVAIGGSSLGLLLGGIVTQWLDWHWIFFINVPIGIATMILAAFLLDESHGLGIAAGADVGGAVLVTAGLMLLVYAIVTSSEHGWLSAHTLVFAAAAVVALAAFFVVEATIANPIMPLRVMRSRGLASTSVARAFNAMGLFSTGFLGVLFLQHLLGLNAIETGLVFLPQTVSLSAMALGPTNRLMRSLHPKPTAVLGFALIFTGLLLFVLATPQTTYFPQLLISMLLLGVGSSMAFTPLLNIGLARIPKAEAGLGSGVINVSQQVSAALCVAILGVVSTNRTRSLLDGGSSLSHALAGGYRLGFVVAAASVAVGAVVVLLFVPSGTAPSLEASPLDTAPLDPAPAGVEP